MKERPAFRFKSLLVTSCNIILSGAETKGSTELWIQSAAPEPAKGKFTKKLAYYTVKKSFLKSFMITR